MAPSKAGLSEGRPGPCCPQPVWPERPFLAAALPATLPCPRTLSARSLCQVFCHLPAQSPFRPSSASPGSHSAFPELPRGRSVPSSQGARLSPQASRLAPPQVRKDIRVGPTLARRGLRTNWWHSGFSIFCSDCTASPAAARAGPGEAARAPGAAGRGALSPPRPCSCGSPRLARSGLREGESRCTQPRGGAAGSPSRSPPPLPPVHTCVRTRAKMEGTILTSAASRWEGREPRGIPLAVWESEPHLLLACGGSTLPTPSGGHS